MLKIQYSEIQQVIFSCFPLFYHFLVGWIHFMRTNRGLWRYASRDFRLYSLIKENTVPLVVGCDSTQGFSVAV